jgi:HEPN domain-containing protein
MGMPKDPNALKFFRVAKQRLNEASLIFDRLSLSSVSIYLAGYSIECILKALILERTPRSRRDEIQLSLKEDFGHSLSRLRRGLIEQRVAIPRKVMDELVYAYTWSPRLRYEPGPGDAATAQRFLTAAKSIVDWADRSF